MISIVMATYNGKNFIEEQLESLRNQTLVADEVIIADDRSTDGTYEFILDYIKSHSLEKWSVYRNENNLGYSKNFSKLLMKASGEIIFLADQDDIWHNDKVEQMYSVMESNKQIQLLASNPHPFYEGNKPQKVNYEKFYGSLIHVSTDQRLMAGKMLLHKFKSQSLRFLASKIVFVFIARIKTDDIVMGLNFIVSVVFSILVIEHFALKIKGVGIAVYSIHVKFAAEHHVPVFIKKWFQVSFIMLIFQIADCRTVISVFYCDVF